MTDDSALDEAVHKEIDDTPLVMDWRRDAGWNTLESLLGLAAGSDGPISLTEALRQSAVLSAGDVITQDVSKVPMYLYERLKGGGKRRVEPDEHWLAEMLALDPNDEHTWSDFFQMVAFHLVFANNSFIVKRTNRSGSLVHELIPVMPGRVMINIHPQTGEKFFDVTRGTMFEQAMLDGIAYSIPAEQMIHCRKRVVDGLNGYSTLGAGGPTIRLSKAIQEYQKRLYENDGQSRLVFKQAGEMKPLADESFQRMKKELRAAGKNMFRNGEPILLEPGYTADTVAMTAEESEIATIRNAQIGEAARLFRVPAHKLMHLDAVKYENLDVIERLYAWDTVEPHCQAIEKPMERSLLTRAERLKFFLEFDRRRIAIIDFKIRAEALKIGLQHGAVMGDEFREEFGMNPLAHKSGRVRMFQSTMTVVDERNEVLIPAGAQPAKDDADKDDDDAADDKKSDKHLRLVK